MTSKTVYILGAGCSVENHAPLIGNFFDVAFELIDQKRIKSSSDKKRFNAIRRYREMNLPHSNIEELLSYIDLKKAITTNKKEKNALNELYRDLIFVIAYTIKLSLITESPGVYDDFVKKCFCGSISCYSVISFNWDILLDNAIENNLANSPPGCPNILDYGSDQFECLNVPPGRSPSNVGYPRLFKVFKLHGSMNWLFCRKCKKIYYQIGQKIVMDYLKESLPCPKCNKKSIRGVIVPPTFNKLGDKAMSIIGDIWHNAFIELSEADRIIILGYSFPEDDVHFKMFFRGALHENYEKRKRSIEVMVINHKRYVTEKASFEEHYRQIINFPQEKVDLKFAYTKFKEYPEKELQDKLFI